MTKQYCGAVLSSLSFYEAARVTLCELGAIAALKGAEAQVIQTQLSTTVMLLSLLHAKVLPS